MVDLMPRVRITWIDAIAVVAVFALTIADVVWQGANHGATIVAWCAYAYALFRGGAFGGDDSE